MLTTITDPLQRQRQRAYNAAGWHVSQTDALGHTTRYSYDRAGRTLSASDDRPATVS